MPALNATHTLPAQVVYPVRPAPMPAPVAPFLPPGMSAQIKRVSRQTEATLRLYNAKGKLSRGGHTGKLFHDIA